MTRSTMLALSSETAANAIREFFLPLRNVADIGHRFGKAFKLLRGWPAAQEEELRLLRQLCAQSGSTTQEIQSLRKELEEQRAQLPSQLRDLQKTFETLTRSQAEREARRLLFLADRLRSSGDTANALEILVRVSRVAEQRNLETAPYAWFNWGELLLERADWSGAELAFKKVVAFPEPELVHANACYSLGLLNLRRSHWGEAIDLSEQAVGTFARLGDERMTLRAYVQLASALSSSGDIERATEILRKALQQIRPQRLLVPDAE